MDHLVIRLGDDPSTGQWAVLDGDGRLVRKAEAGPLIEAAEAARGRRVVVLAPAVDVISTAAQLPKSTPTRLRKMVPYSLEEALADDIDELFFAVGPRFDSGAVSVAVVARRQLEAWLAALEQAGIMPQAVYSEGDGVPDTPATLTLVLERERIYGRAPGQPPFVFDGIALDEALETIRGEDAAAEPKHALVYADNDARALHQDALAALASTLSSVDVKLMPDGALYRFGATLATRPGTNLLQGPYAPKSNWDALLRPWRFAASLLVGLLLLAVVGQAAEYVALRQEDRALTSVLEQQCQTALGAAALDACEATARARLGQSGLSSSGRPDFLATLSAIAASRGPQSRIEALSFRNQVMDLQLVVPDVPALDEFAQKVEGAGGLEVGIQSANPSETGVEGRLQIVGAPE